MKVKSVAFNWRVSPNERIGCDFEISTVGYMDVVSIQENEPCNGLQQWNYVVEMKDGSKQRIFNPNFVEYFPGE